MLSSTQIRKTCPQQVIRAIRATLGAIRATLTAIRATIRAIRVTLRAIRATLRAFRAVVPKLFLSSRILEKKKLFGALRTFE